MGPVRTLAPAEARTGNLKKGKLTVLRRTAEDTGEGRIPDRLQSGVICLAFLQPQQPLGMALLDKLDLLHVHLDIVELVSTDGEARIHPLVEIQRFRFRTSRRWQTISGRMYEERTPHRMSTFPPATA